jgi:hypothetical protein
MTGQDLIARPICNGDYEVIAGAKIVGRIHRLPSVGRETWWWGVFFEHHRSRTPLNGIEDTFEDATTAFRRDWEKFGITADT